MGHHSQMPFDDANNEAIEKLKASFGKPISESSESIEKLQEQLHQLGATGKFPDGKLTDNDEGEIAIGITEKDGRVILNFGKQIEWIGFTKQQALDIAVSLIQKANS